MTTSEAVTLTGRIVRPDDPDYSAASAGWNQFFAHQPATVVFAATTADVVNALAWARQHDVPIRVRSGRHNLEGWNAVDGGLVIDVSELKSVAIDPQSQTATVGAGLNQLEAVTALGAAGFAAPTGTEGSVGLVGATLGGGFGLLTRAYGMASDNLLAAEVVVAAADGGAEAITVNTDENPDLLWALRGAGNGNFGIVTSLTYRIHPLAQAIYVVATWEGLDDLPAVFDAWQRSAPHTDPSITSQLEITSDAVVLIAALTSGAEDDAHRLLHPVLSVGTPEVSTTTADWADIYTDFQIPITEEPANWKFFSQFATEPFPPAAIDVLCSFMATAPPGCNYFTNALAGAVPSSEPSGGSAYAHRGALFYAEPGAGWGVRGQTPTTDEETTRRCLAWVAALADALRPFVNGAYVNVPNADEPHWETDYWGPNVERLRAVKASYDPTNVFHFEQSIPPAGER